MPENALVFSERVHLADGCLLEVLPGVAIAAWCTGIERDMRWTCWSLDRDMDSGVVAGCAALIYGSKPARRTPAPLMLSKERRAPITVAKSALMRPVVTIQVALPVLVRA